MLKIFREQTLIPSLFSLRLGLIVGVFLLSVSIVLQGDFFSASLTPLWRTFTLLVLIVLLACMILDGIAALKQRKLRVKRTLPTNMPVNKDTHVTLAFDHTLPYGISLQVMDDIPETFSAENTVHSMTVEPNKKVILKYRVRPCIRGPHAFRWVDLRVKSPLGLWEKQYRVGMLSEARVFPDFSLVSGLKLLASENNIAQAGLKRRQRRGDGMDFHQLREFREGDVLRQVDWKATSRRQSLISREYQEERNQSIVIMLDGGRRMRAMDGELTQFDHALNASLLLSYLALRQGDRVNIMNFSDKSQWLTALRGPQTINSIINGLYDTQTKKVATDYIGGAKQVLSQQKKRALVIMVTNTRDEDTQELNIATALLRKKHALVLVNLRESHLDAVLTQPVVSLEAALTFSGVLQYLSNRQSLHNGLKQQGVYAVDTLARYLPSRVCEAYLSIKAQGAL